MLLFKVYVGSGNYRSIPIFISRENRTKVSNFFNYLSARIPYFVSNGVNSAEIMKLVDTSASTLLQDDKNQRRILEAMENSISDDDDPMSARPWITFISFRQRRPGIPGDLETFISGMVNAIQIRELLISSSYSDGSILVKFPLPLGNYLGRILTTNEFEELRAVLTKLEDVKRNSLDTDYRLLCQTILNESKLPVEYSLSGSLPLISRDGAEFHKTLT